jgi:hypothetical protein
MKEPKSLDSLFKEKIFRIPDYQRGYAWRTEQLKQFWEDLINLTGDRAHYTGVLTLKLIPETEIPETSREYWLVDDHSYRVYHIVDGQQRLTTFIVFLQALVDFIRLFPENSEKQASAIYISESLNLAGLQERYLFKTKPTGDQFRTYKFGYETDNPSYDYLRFRILGEAGSGQVEETFYTLNLSNAKRYFSEQFRDLYAEGGIASLQEIYKKLTKRFLFNEYIIRDEFDVFVAFETMNNRGKKLSDLELLKNRLIYLATLYDDVEMDSASKKSLRHTVNDAWKEVYHQLGRNKSRPLSDDEYLRAHWTMYFKYLRQTGRDYIHFLLDEQFTSMKIHKKLAAEVMLEPVDEAGPDEEFEENDEEPQLPSPSATAVLPPTEIRDFTYSLKDSANHWFNSYYPELAIGLSDNERAWLDRLNRIGIGYFRPLIMAILKNEAHEDARTNIFRHIERFIFIAFRLNSANSNYGSSEFYNIARALDRRETDLAAISNKLDQRLSYCFTAGDTFRISDFYNLLYKRFNTDGGYYGWGGLKYFLFEYEMSLLSESRQPKVGWNDLLRTDADRDKLLFLTPEG